MTAQLMETVHKRDFYHRKAKQLNYLRYWTLYEKTKNFVNVEVKRCKAKYYARIINENKQNYGTLWKMLNEVTSSKQNGPVSCVESDGVILYNQKSIASIINQHFSSVATKLVQKLKAGKTIFVASDLSNIFTSSRVLFRFMPVSEQFVLNKLKRLKTS